MTEEEKKAIKSMKRFVECRQDMTAVTAREMKIVLDLLEKKDKIIDEMALYIKDPYEVITIGSRKPKTQIIKEYFERKVENGN